MANCMQHFILTIELVDSVPMLVLTYQRQYVKGPLEKKALGTPHPRLL
jgi:hypothetical protein